MPIYTGKVCSRHSELNGQRRNGNCPACQRERVRPKRPRASQRAKVKKWRDANRDRYRAGAHKRTAAARARLREATVGNVVEIRRAFVALKRRAKRQGLTVDHIVPIAGCRVCGRLGLHEPNNWQMITGPENAAKGDRCRNCSSG